MLLFGGTMGGGVDLPIDGLGVIVACFRPASISARLFTWPEGAASEDRQRRSQQTFN